jgi:hypothetical protein
MRVCINHTYWMVAVLFGSWHVACHTALRAGCSHLACVLCSQHTVSSACNQLQLHIFNKGRLPLPTRTQLTRSCCWVQHALLSKGV